MIGIVQNKGENISRTFNLYDESSGVGDVEEFSNDTSPYTRNVVLSTKRSQIKKLPGWPGRTQIKLCEIFFVGLLGVFPRWLESNRGKQPRGRDAPSPASAEPQSSAQLLGRMGRMDDGRNGLFHLLPGFGSSLARAVAKIWDRSDHGECWVLRRTSLRSIHDRLGNRSDLGSNR